MRTDGRRHVPGRHVGVDVVVAAVLADAHRGHHGDVVALDEVLEVGGVDVVDLAHAAKLGVELRAHERAGVGARDAHGQVAVAVDAGHEVLVDLAHEHLAHHVHGLGRGDTLAVLELHREVQALERAVDGLAATVHDHHVDAQDLEQHDIAHDVGTQLGALHGRTAVLDDDGLAGDVLDPREGLEQHLAGTLVGQLRAAICLSCELHDGIRSAGMLKRTGERASRRGARDTPNTVSGFLWRVRLAQKQGDAY